MAITDHSCPICVDKIMLAPDGHCVNCERDWYELPAGGEATLEMKPRRVRLTKMPEVGDRLDDVIKPAKDQ